VTTILLCVGAFFAGCFCGAVLASILAAAGQADDHIQSMCMPAATITDLATARVTVRDFDVVTDDEGRDHIVPTEAPPPAERGSPPAG
jgi:hypothetical protein